MSTTTATSSPSRRRVSPRLIGWGLAAVVVLAIALDTTYKDPDYKVTASGRPAFNPEQYGRTTFPKAAAALEKNAQPLPALVSAMSDDAEAAGKKFGHRSGTGPYSFAVKGDGIAGKAENGVLPVKVKGLPKSTTVAIQVGPALPGTAVRDAAGFIEFGQFLNQVEFADAATALNNEVKARVLKDVDAQALRGKRVSFVGAFTSLVPTAITITPVKLEPAS
jgi:predicted lipoprotein